MSFKHTLLLVALFFVSLLLFVPKIFAAQLTGKVVDSLDTPLSNTKIEVKDTATNKLDTTFMTDPFGNYILQVPNGTYTFSVNPSTGTGIPAITKAITVSGNMKDDITMQTASKLPKTSHKTSAFGSISKMNFLVICVLILIIIGFILWKYKKITFSK